MKILKRFYWFQSQLLLCHVKNFKFIVLLKSYKHLWKDMHIFYEKNISLHWDNSRCNLVLYHYFKVIKLTFYCFLNMILFLMISLHTLCSSAYNMFKECLCCYYVCLYLLRFVQCLTSICLLFVSYAVLVYIKLKINWMWHLLSWSKMKNTELRIKIKIVL